jgi:hypothetical protein
MRGWQGFAGIWATSDEDSRMCWRGLLHLSRLDGQGVFEALHALFQVLDLALLLGQQEVFDAVQARGNLLGSVSKVEMAIFTLPVQRHSG